MRTILTRLLPLLIAVPPVGAQADVYVHKDAAGVEHYTNQAGLSGYDLIISVLAEEGGDNRARAMPEVAGVAKYAKYIDEAADEFAVDRALVHAVITAESGYNAKAVSHAGAQGLMQLMPTTARRYDVDDAFDPAQNIRGGTRYLRDLLDMFDGDMRLAVAAYNAGENAVIRHGRQVPPYRETRAYVPKVLRLFESYSGVL